MRKFGTSVLVLVGSLSLLGSALVAFAAADSPKLERRAVVPDLSRAEPEPTATVTPTPVPQPYSGPVSALYVPSANIDGSAPVEERGTHFEGSHEVFDDPTRPGSIAWYSDPRFGHPGFGGQNSVFAGHINYVNYGNGPFANLINAQDGGSLYITMANGQQYTYTIIQVDVLSVSDLVDGAMDRIVFPNIDRHSERVTLISCGGDFIAYPGGGGEYASRVIVVAERYVP
ncbi:MAG: class F sortase [Dehalococcoidia bacterium]|nr:class F sortase [Dehalococcoidia bacterium]